MRKIFIIGSIVGFYQYLEAIQTRSIYDIMKERSDIEYIKCHEAKEFVYDSFPILRLPERSPFKGFFAETFILRIPEGEVFGSCGFLKIGSCLIRESAYQNVLGNMKLLTHVQKMLHVIPQKIKGRVAVISGYDDCYSHWMHDVLGKLIMLKEYNVEYDWLCVSFNKKYQKETLLAFGIDLQKIIEPKGLLQLIQADTLIVPSLPACRVMENEGVIMNFFLAYYYADWVIDYLRKLFLPLSEKVVRQFSKKVFISRSDASYRIVENEDEIFNLFEQKGFFRYKLSELSVVEQVALFRQAEIIVGAHGSGFVNLIFCNPGTRVVELFQGRLDLSFFYIAQQMKLDYQHIKTIDFLDGYGHKSFRAPLFIFKDFLARNSDW